VDVEGDDRGPRHSTEAEAHEELHTMVCRIGGGLSSPKQMPPYADPLPCRNSCCGG
jgi:hypothetical protein